MDYSYGLTMECPHWAHSLLDRSPGSDAVLEGSEDLRRRAQWKEMDHWEQVFVLIILGAFLSHSLLPNSHMGPALSVMPSRSMSRNHELKEDFLP